MRKVTKYFAFVLSFVFLTVLLASCGSNDNGAVENETFTIIYVSNGGTELTNETVKSGEKAIQKLPQKDGYEFAEWYESINFEGTPYDFSKPVRNNITLYAKWNKIVSELSVKSYSGYTEGMYAIFTDKEASKVTVEYSFDEENWTKVDKELIRQQSSDLTRVDVVGLHTGYYSLKITSSCGVVKTLDRIYVNEDDRSGYAHFGRTTGVGAYNNDGTLKDKAVVVYVTDDTKNTVTATYGNKQYTGLANILKAAKDGSLALDIRILGEIQTTQWNKMDYPGVGSSRERQLAITSHFELDNSSAEVNDFWNVGTGTSGSYNRISADKIIEAEYNSMSDDIEDGIVPLDGLTSYVSRKKSPNAGNYEFDSYWNMLDVSAGKNITIEGIGTDAKIFQWGITFNRCESIEVKNLEFNNYTEDAIGIQGGSNSDNDYSGFWIHNCEFNIGQNNWDVSYEGDKNDGDGATDFKYAHNLTISYTQYNRTHKTNLIGANDSSLQYNVTLHHNYYNNCGSRLPLVRQTNLHVYNCYYSNTTGYCDSIRANCYALVENNYYEKCKNPYQITSAGAAKIYNNTFNGCTTTSSYRAENNVKERDEVVSNSCSPDGKTDYSKFDTDAKLFYYDSENKRSSVMLLESAAEAKETTKQFAGVLKENVIGGPITAGQVHEIEFDTDGGNEISNISVRDGKTVTLPIALKAGYKFIGWYDSENNTLVDATTVIKKSYKLLAKWELKTGVKYSADDFDANSSFSGADLFAATEFELIPSSRVTVVKNFSNAKTEDGTIDFDNGFLPSGATSIFTLTAKQTCKIEIFYTVSDGSFALTNQSKEGDLTINGVSCGQEGKKDNKVVYSYIFDITEGEEYTIKSSSNRLVLYGLNVL